MVNGNGKCMIVLPNIFFYLPSLMYRPVDWTMEAMVVPGGQVEHNLVQSLRYFVLIKQHSSSELFFLDKTEVVNLLKILFNLAILYCTLVLLVINTRRYFALVVTFKPCSSGLNERRTTFLRSTGDYLVINN